MLPRPFLLLVLLVGAIPSQPLAGWTDGPSLRSDRVSLFVSPKVRVRDVHRVGLNLGIWTSWGAEQLGSNIIKNPGFEGLVDGALAIVKSVSGSTLVLEGLGVRRAEGFWNNGSLDFRTGISAGKSVRIKEFHRTDTSGLARIVLESEIAVSKADVVALAKVDDAGAPTQWWLSANQSRCAPGPPRPGSAGVRSLDLCSTDSQRAEVNSYFDETTARSGKMLLIRGKWRFSLWLKTLQGSPLLTVSFGRRSSKPFFSRDIKPASTWRHIFVDFDAIDDGPDGPLELHLIASGDGRTLVDDVSLSSMTDGNCPFRHQVVDALAKLSPGYLRDWQGQLGDTISNRLAQPFSRRASRYRSDKEEDAKYGYSIPEFLQLCQKVRANPWLVVPTTASDADYIKLGSYLARTEAQMHFREVLVEFGNENWNPLFGAAGIQDAKHHAEAAARAFKFLREGARAHVPLRTVVNAQFANASGVAALIAENVSDLVAVAPYFAYELPTGAVARHDDATLFASEELSFGNLAQEAAQRGKGLAVYEVNLHTTGGSASAAERDRFVLSAEAGAGLAKRLIEAMSSGIQPQCVYSLAGFDAYTSDHSGFVQLWGVVRDLAGAPRLRATGLAVSLLNDAVQEEVHDVQAQGHGQSEGLTAIAFRGSRGWSAAIVSARSEAVKVNLSIPAKRGEVLPAISMSLPEQVDNRDGVFPERGRPLIVHEHENVVIKVNVPGRSLVVVTPERMRSDTWGATQ